MKITARQLRKMILREVNAAGPHVLRHYRSDYHEDYYFESLDELMAAHSEKRDSAGEDDYFVAYGPLKSGMRVDSAPKKRL